MAQYEGYTDVVSKLQSLLTTFPPEFIYIHDPTTPRISAQVIHECIQTAEYPLGVEVLSAFVNAVTCFTPRLLYDTVLNSLAKWEPKWEDGCKNWQGVPGSSGQRSNDSFDAFVHGIQSLRASVVEGTKRKITNGKGKAKQKEIECRMILVVERAERLKEVLPDLMVPLVRLGELAQIEITTIFLSEARWEQIRPPLGSSPDPYFIDVLPLSKNSILDRLGSVYPEGAVSSSLDPNTYHPALRPLYDHFLAALYGICSPFTTDPDDLSYLAASRWPGFVQPILDEYQQLITQLNNDHRSERENASGYEDQEDVDAEGDEDIEIPELTPPSEDTRIRLIRLFTPTFTAALEALYPRLSSATEWAKTNKPPPNLLSIPPRHAPSLVSKIATQSQRSQGVETLPRMVKFILLASFLASTNPAKTDLRMFGRGLDERTKRRKRKAGAPRKTSAKSTAVKIPQRLLGPLAFPLDRMIAILGILLEENDVETRPPAPEYNIPGEYTEMEISRIAIYAQVMQLASMQLLHRASPSDKLDLNPSFKCGITYEVALGVARSIDVPLNDMMWDPA